MSVFKSGLIFSFLAVLVFSAGCGKKSNRLHVYGEVTWKGKPVPAGMITFSPDNTKGNKGPDGFALIIDGKYDSEGQAAKGCTAGPQIVTIAATTGKNITINRPYGNPICQAYVKNYDFPKEGGRINFEIPENHPAITTVQQAE